MQGEFLTTKRAVGGSMKEVIKEEFYNFVGDKELVTEIKGDYPYTTYWRGRRDGVIYAKHVEAYPPNGLWPLIDTYFISEEKDFN